MPILITKISLVPTNSVRFVSCDRISSLKVANDIDLILCVVSKVIKVKTHDRVKINHFTISA